jgi:hypothetical protein
MGDNCHITSDYGMVKIKNLGAGAHIKASKDIVIDGYCPNDADLKSNYGKVRKSLVAQGPSQAKVQAPVHVPGPTQVASSSTQIRDKKQNHKEEEAYLVAKFESDLQHAIIASKNYFLPLVSAN